jgi:tRNA threonylcarbamoyladenosine biosynthesis protein TsaB
MKILAVDTATRSCSVAVIDGEKLLAESTLDNDQTHSRHLLSLIDAVIKKSGWEIARLDGFAVSIGPGSFTGLRIGIASVKGLAFSLNKPVVGVSSLEALAFQCRQQSNLICPVIDARKQEVYFGFYRSGGGKLTREAPEQVAPPEKAVQGIRESCLFIGNGAELYRDLIISKLGHLAQFASAEQHAIRASAIARLSLPRFKRQETDDLSLLVPHYIRKSDAELSLKVGNALKSQGYP